MSSTIRTCVLLVFLFAATITSLRAAEETLVHGARKEGTLVIYTSMTVDQAQKLNDASFGRVPTRRGVPTTAQGIDKLNYVIDFGAGDDFNKNFELFRNIFRRAEVLMR